MLQAGDSVGRYRIERRLGHGGMGTLHLAHDPVLDRQVALKLLLGDIERAETRERFVREARAAAALSNPNIVTIYDYGDYASQPYIVMEYIHGETLADVIRRKADLPIQMKLRWLEELCSAVGYAHARGVIHRDIKPPNLMIDSYGRLKVLDFGIARMRGTLATNATAMIGTPGYCAPEQIRGGEIDHRSDLFSIGVVSYELLSYVEPFSGETAHVITHRILNEEPKPLSEACPGSDPELESVVMRALQKEPADRFASADELRSAFAVVRGRIEAEADSTIVRYIPRVAPMPPASAPPSGTPGNRSSAAPSSDGGRTERENAARMRVAQIHEHLRAARVHLDAGRALEALADCEAALKLDDAHPAARRLRTEAVAAREEAITKAIDDVRAGLDQRQTRAVESGLETLRKLDPDNPEVGRLTRELRVLRADQERVQRKTQQLNDALTAAESALARCDFDEALARVLEALDLEPSSSRALELKQLALSENEGSGGATPAAASSTSTPTAEDLDRTVVRPQRSTPNVTSTPKPEPQASRPQRQPLKSWYEQWASPRVLMAAAGAVVAISLIVLMVAMSPVAPAPASIPVMVTIDAAPWATVTSVRAEDGKLVEPLPDERSTPLTLELVPGTYQVTLGRTGQPGERTFSVRVEPGKSTIALQQFETVNADEFIESYLQAAPQTIEQPSPPVDNAERSGESQP